MYIFINLLKSV